MATHEADGEQLFSQAADHVLDSMRRAITERDRFVLGIVGGRSMPALFEGLLKRKLPGGEVHIFWLDERVSGDKNFTPALPYLERLSEAVQASWYPLVSLDRDGMEAEAARVFQQFEALGGTFDLVVLSAGEDCHICSLFPQDPALHVDDKGYTMVENAPKPPPTRVSVTPPVITGAREVILLFADKSKRDAYERFRDEDAPFEQCPAKLVHEVERRHVFVPTEF